MLPAGEDYKIISPHIQFSISIHAFTVNFLSFFFLHRTCFIDVAALQDQIEFLNNVGSHWNNE